MDAVSPRDIFDLTGKVAVVTGAGSGLGRAISEAMAQYGANVVCVGWTAQKLQDTVSSIAVYGHHSLAVTADLTDPDSVEALVPLLPLGRPGMPAEIKGLAVWLASDASSFVTGQIFIEEGGYLA